MSDRAYADRLGHAITSTGLATVVRASYEENQIHVLCRVLKGSEHTWLQVIQRLHRSTTANSRHAHSWRTQTSKDYFTMEKDGQERFGYIWRVSITSPHMKDSLDYVSAAIRGESVANAADYKVRPGEVTEMTFTGMDPSYQRNVASGGKMKGVYTIGGKNDLRIRRGG